MAPARPRACRRRGLVGGLVGAAYIGLLHLLQRVLWPDHWNGWGQAAVLLAVGVVVAVGHQADGRAGHRRAARRQHPRDRAAPTTCGRCRRSCRSRCCASAPAVRSGPRHRSCRRPARSGRGSGARRGSIATERRIVTITGMAAGFTVLFGAPLGGAVFALEILHRRGLEYYEALMPAVVGSLCGYGVYVGITGVGLEPVWSFPSAGALRAGDLPGPSAAASAGAAVAVVFTLPDTGLRAGLRRGAAVARPVLGGAGLALLAAAVALRAHLRRGADRRRSTSDRARGRHARAGRRWPSCSASSVDAGVGWKGGFIIPLFFMGVCLGQAGHALLPHANALGAHRRASWWRATSASRRRRSASTLVVTEMAGHHAAADHAHRRGGGAPAHLGRRADRDAAPPRRPELMRVDPRSRLITRVSTVSCRCRRAVGGP